MKRLFFISAFLLGLIFSVNAQEEVSEQPNSDAGKSKKELKAERKAAKKEARQQAASEALAKSNAMIESQIWVLEATQIQGTKGQTFQLDPTINFVMVNNEDATIQLGFNALVGWNGLGGVTLEGKVIRYDVTPPKKEGQGAKVTAQFQGAGVSARMTLSVRGEFADVTLNGTFSNTRLRFSGVLAHPSNSRAFKGIRTN